jgi:hypothetical protein
LIPQSTGSCELRTDGNAEQRIEIITRKDAMPGPFYSIVVQ